jgi:peptidyl-prolyl cis-trans isomerase C
MAIALALSGAACSSCNEKALDNAKQADAGAHQTSGSLTAEQAAKVLARVGDQTITLGDYVAALEHMDQFDRLRYQSPERRKELLTEMINVMLLAQEAKEKGYDKDPATQQELRAILRDAMLEQAHKGLPGPGEIPEADVHAYYDAHKGEFRDPERRRLSLIVLKDEATSNQTLELARRATSASQWGELVKSRSIDPQAKANVPVDLVGDVGMVSPPGDTRGENAKVPDEVRAGAFEIPKVGEVLARTVKAGGKFYVVRLTQKSEAHERGFQEAERPIRVRLAQDRIHEKEEALLNELRAEFPVQIDEGALKNVRAELPDAASHD